MVRVSKLGLAGDQELAVLPTCRVGQSSVSKRLRSILTSSGSSHAPQCKHFLSFPQGLYIVVQGFPWQIMDSFSVPATQFSDARDDKSRLRWMSSKKSKMHFLRYGLAPS